MSKLVKIFAIVAAVALVVFAPQLAPMIGQFLGASGFLATAIGAVVIAVGLTALQMLPGLFTPSGSGSSMEGGKVNVRMAEAPRWICAGIARQGGAVPFAEFDSAGNLWYIVIHSDSILIDTSQIYFDDIKITLDGSGWVQNPEFRLSGKKRDPVETTGAGDDYVQMWTTTYTEDDPTPAAISALNAAFPSKWTSDHKLVGTTFSVVKMKAIPLADRYKLFKWRGPIGLGEPAVSIAGQWSNMYDPRDGTQTLGDRTTYKPSKNAALIWAWFRTHPYGRKKPESSIDWAMVAEQANICDQTVDGLVGTHVRYECGIAIPDNKARIVAEQEILLSMDGQLVFTDEGKTWARAGAWYTPTLAFSRNRDIMAMESVEAQDGESETQGVVVRYTDPETDYNAQPSAAWLNPNYYVAGEGATFLTIDILACQDHNQAMRLAKAIGMRSQPLHKILPTTGLRGLRGRKERIATINYDNTFAGDYEIATPVEVDAVGVFCGFGAVPIDEDRWDLLAGEEKPKPVIDSGSSVAAPPLPTGVTFTYNNARIEANFTPNAREDVGYEFEYIRTADLATDIWRSMTVVDEDGFAYSGTVPFNDEFTHRYRSISASGRVSDWSTTGTINVYATGGPLQIAIYNSFIVEAETMPVIHIDSTGSLTIDNHTRRYPDGYPDTAVTGDTIATGLSSGDARAIYYDDPDRAGGAVTYALATTDTDAHVSTAHPGRHYVGYFTVPASGSVDGGGGGIDGPCVGVYVPVLLANDDQNGPGIEVPARDLRPGHCLWTQHEITLEWGAYTVEAIEFVRSEVWQADDYPDATEYHRFFIDGEWVEMRDIGQPKRMATVAKITVTDAHTYLSAGVLSHNIKAGGP